MIRKSSPTDPSPAVTPGETSKLATVSSTALASDLNRIKRDEQERIDKAKQAELARQRELARFD